ncbi:MAG: methylamine dehydrogenase accessory protein MauD [Actinomycetota bacterium]
MHGWWAVSYIVLWIMVVTLAVLVVALARQIGALHMRLGPRGALEIDTEGPPLGSEAPARTTLDREGHPVTVGGRGDPQLLLFVSPECPVCREVLPSVAVVARQGRLTPFVVVDDPDPDGVGDTGAPVVPDPELARNFNVPGTPYAVFLDDRGTVRAKGTVNNLEQMEGLLETAIARLNEAGHPVAQ